MRSRWVEHPFCQAFPVAHLMREHFPECWLRIHSLPGSKRYPESDAEREIVFERIHGLVRHCSASALRA